MANRIYKICVSFDRCMSIISIFSHHFPLILMSMFDDDIISFLSWFYLTFSCCPKCNRFAIVFFSKCVINNNLYFGRILSLVLYHYHKLFRLLLKSEYNICALFHPNTRQLHSCSSDLRLRPSQEIYIITKLNEQMRNWHMFNSWRRINK